MDPLVVFPNARKVVMCFRYLASDTSALCDITKGSSGACDAAGDASWNVEAIVSWR